jgi:hypothetical protein
VVVQSIDDDPATLQELATVAGVSARGWRRG